jgi:hypothetical protein
MNQINKSRAKNIYNRFFNIYYKSKTNFIKIIATGAWLARAFWAFSGPEKRAFGDLGEFLA